MTYELPSGGFRSLTFNALSSVGTASSPFTYKAQRFVWQGEQVGFVIEMPPMLKEKAQEWEAWFTRVGEGNEFWLTPSQFMLETSQTIGAPMLTGLSTGRTLETEGWTPHTDALPVGAWVSIGARLHKVTAPVVSDAEGRASLEVWPKIQQVRAGTEIVWRNPRGRFRVVEGTPPMNWGPQCYLEGFSFTAVQNV